MIISQKLVDYFKNDLFLTIYTMFPVKITLLLKGEVTVKTH